MGGQGLISAKETIATLRKTLRTNLHDPISFVDLARAHVLVGNLVAARRAAQIAIGLAPDNRFVLRSLSRFWIHDGDVERAHYALLRSDRTRIDPWLMAAEISVASVGGKSPRTVREGRRTIDSKDRSPGQLSELAGALGTLETLSGKRKLARDMFTFSVTDPTENALAQAVWAERVGIPVEIPSDRLSKSHEALTWRARAVGEWGLAIEACWKWLEQEPFSKIPATLGSFMCSIVERYEDASRFADLGIEANDKDVVLQNNFAFAEISMNKLHSGLMALRKAHLMAQTPHEKRLVSATSALSYFRRGIASSGREIYRRVINEALQGNEHSTVAIASAFWAKAEIDVGEGFEKEPIGIFMKASRSSMEPEIRFFKGQFLEIK